MTDEPILPIAPRPERPSSPTGRPVDLIATGLAALGATVSLLAAIWFFLGFAENDTRPEHLTSAFVLTAGLFAFAIVPFAVVAAFGHRAYRSHASRAQLLWTLFLMLPWVGLGLLSISYTPLPVWCGVVITTLAILLCLWAFISLCLDWKRVSNPAP